LDSHHWSEAERLAIEEQLERLLANRHFSHSRRFPAFLRFVVQKTLTNSTDLLKERTLGVEIFGRAADYDTSSDPIVRVTAAEIRKRIAQYYQEPDHEGELRILLEAGSYVPLFQWPAEAHAGSAAQKPQAGHGSHEQIEAVPAVVVTSERAMVAAGVAARGRWWGPFLLGVVAALAMTGFAYESGWHGLRRSPIDFFWGPVLNSGDPALFCIVEQSQLTNLAVDAADPTRKIVVNTAMSAVNADDLETIVRVGSVLLGRGKKYTLKSSEATTLSDLRAGPVIFVGAFDNAWTMRLTKPLRYHFGNNPGFTEEWIADSTSSTPPEWFTKRPKVENANNYREYAIVARFTDPDTGQLCIIAAGIGQGSTLAAGEFLTDPASLAELEQMARGAGNKKNIEVVLSTQIIDGQPGTPKIEATHFW
jgi:hypothetical protein